MMDILEDIRDNANMSPNPEMFHKYAADKVTKKIAYQKLLTPYEVKCHKEGWIHIHDMEYFLYRPLNCLQHDLRFFIRNGVKVDGDGLHTSMAKPAKNLYTLINHAGQIMGAGQTNMSGGQSIPFFNVFLAPYVKGVDDETLKQAMQMFIFNLNMSYVSRGGQAIFSSINIDLSMPDFLMDEPAWFAGKQVGVYGDYIDEMERIAHSYIDVMMEGDGNGKPHLFPNSVFQVNRGTNLDDWDDLFHLIAKFGLPYFAQPIDDNYATMMGCRTRLATNWTGDWEQDVIRTGNINYISLNLPRYAIDYENFYSELEYYMDIAAGILLKRRELAKKYLDKHYHLKFLSQKDVNGEPYYRLENGTLSFGIVGLYEAVELLDGYFNEYKAHQILDFINRKAQELKDETGYRWTVIASPAESTAGKFANLNEKMYGGVSNVKGIKGAYYYTNSTHIPVNSETNIIDKIVIEAPFHRKTQGGNILNLFMGEISHPMGLKSLTRKIIDKTDTGFWAFTTVFCICKSCHTQFRGMECPNCNSYDIEIYDRITGYVQKVSGWNDSKKAEFVDRKRFNI